MAVSVGSLLHDDTVSGNAANIWWIAGHIGRMLSGGHHGLGDALTSRVELVFISDVVAKGYPNPRLIGSVLAFGFIAWAIWIARRARSLEVVALLGAFVLHAYALLSAQVHENHLVGAVPLLVLAAAIDARYRWLCAAVSAIVAANMYLFYGLTGDGPAPLARTITGVDATLVLSLINVIAFAWFARLFAAAAAAPGIETAWTRTAALPVH
jgi:hypothetical protein